MAATKTEDKLTQIVAQARSAREESDKVELHAIAP